jgi:hypothetical protein
MVSHALGRVMQTASASAAPQSDPSVYAQYWLAVQVLPARAPQAEPGGGMHALASVTLVPAAAARQALP